MLESIVCPQGPEPEPYVTLFNPGQCCVCGCTEARPCHFHSSRPLWWVDRHHTVCAAPKCFKLWRLCMRPRRLHR